MLCLTVAELQKKENKVVTFKGSNQVEISGSTGALSTPRSSSNGTNSRVFAFDRTFWSFDKSSSEIHNSPFADQQSVFEDLVSPLLDHAFSGFNTCMFAYGQTGSGKSYTMLGFKNDPGVIPRVGAEMFDRIQKNSSNSTSYNVTVAYYEIYNEKVRDLLNLKNRENLKVREHPLHGPYVEDLSKLAVKSYDELNSLLLEGNKTRTVASTNMNQSSSRSHAIFSITLTQTELKEGLPVSEKVSRIHLVDLAGSERARTSGTSGSRLKEGAEINRSLSTLGRVITALAEKAFHPSRQIAVPYRDSTLTWLLKDALGGNSMTAMLATISPSFSNYEQTLSTLRFAQNVKKIKTHAVVNEDPNAKLIRELKEELTELRSQLGTRPKAEEQSDIERQDLMEKLSVSEKLLKEVNQTWEQKLSETVQIQKDTANALEELGISIEDGFVGLHTPRKVPFLVNLSEDPSLTECLVYNIRNGSTMVGHVNNADAEIRLSGSQILFEHCTFINLAGVVTLSPFNSASVVVNGDAITEPRELHTGYRIILGHAYIFRYSNPLEKNPAPENRVDPNSLVTATTDNKEALRFAASTPPPRDVSSRPPLTPSEADWEFTLNEAAAKVSGYNEASLEALEDDELQNLYSQVLRVKNSRTSYPGSALGFRDELSPSPLPSNFDPSTSPRRMSRLSMGDSSELLGGSPRFRRPRASSITSTNNVSPRRRSLIYPPLDLSVPPSPVSSIAPATITKRESLLKKYVRIWRGHSTVQQIDTLFSCLPLIRKAQNYSNHFDLNMSFQLMVTDGLLHSPYEKTVNPIYDDNDTKLSVRVMDSNRDIVHIVSPGYLQSSLPQTDNFEHLEKPHLPLRFASNQYTLIGYAARFGCKVGTTTVDLLSPYTHSTMGAAKLNVKRTTTAPLSALKKNAMAVSTDIATLEIYGNMVEEVIDLHASLFIGDESTPRLVTPVVSLEKDGMVTFPSYFHIDVENTPYLRLLVYASVRLPFLDRLVSWDGMQEPGFVPTTSRPATPIVLFQDPRSSETYDPENSSFMDRIASERARGSRNARFCVGIYLKIKELNENGEYVAVDVIGGSDNTLPPYSFLHQGLQRRIELTLLTSDDCLDDFDDTNLDVRLKIGDVRQVDSQGMLSGISYVDRNISGDSTHVELKNVSKVKRQTDQGFVQYTVTYQWPSTHDLFDFITPDTNRLLFNVKVVIGRDENSIALKCPMSASIKSRVSTGVSRWEVLFGQVRVDNNHSFWFVLRNGYNRVPKTKRDFDRVLGGNSSCDDRGVISQRGVSLLMEYYLVKQASERALEKQAASDKFDSDIRTETGNSEDQTDFLRECIDLWQKKTLSKIDVVSTQLRYGSICAVY